MITAHHRLVVLGNGPSLKGVDLPSLGAADTLGMNAAYRYWERIGWYPTHYCCLDDQLIDTHAGAIHDLIVSGKVRSAFLIARILERHPDLAGRDNVFFLEGFNRIRQARLADPRVPLIKSLPFRESDASKVTTGAYAVRYAAHLGYREIAILGVDLRYVELIPEARQAEGIKLVMETTPTTNPNYFFDDYQRAGDKFNVPNPAAHSKNLHVAAFEALAHDIVAFEWKARVFNANRQSVLFDNAILPFREPSAFAPRRSLGAVVVPTTAREEEQLLLNLQVWDEPRLCPCAGAPMPGKPDLVIAFSGPDDAALRQRILAVYEKTRFVKRCFERIEVRFVGMDETLDYYERDYSRPVTGHGYKSGPNEQFFELVSALHDRGEFIFYMESDCAPLRQGWLDKLQQVAAGDAESWVVGSLYRGVEGISPRFLMHLNGNALYRAGDPAFQRFVEQHWRPSLRRHLAEDPRLAYDCVLSHMFTAADPRDGNADWQLFQQVGHRLRATELIQNLSGAADQRGEAADAVRRLLAESPQTDLVHGRHFTRLLHAAWQQFRASHAATDDFSWAVALAGDAGMQPPAASRAVPDPGLPAPTPPERSMSALPRLLIIDPTVVAGPSATGQIKKVFLQGWPASQWMQVAESSGALLLRGAGATASAAAIPHPDLAEVLRRCQAFRPEVIYFRATDSEPLFELLARLTAATPVAVVVHMMDDWPDRLRSADASRHARLDQRLRRVLAAADGCLSIGEAMSKAYALRYGRAFTPLANGVDLAEVPARDWSDRPAPSPERPFVIRYLGGLAEDMTLTSVVDLATAVSTLAAELHVRLEIRTMNWYLERARAAVAGLAGVSVLPLVADGEYLSQLGSADALLIAYNFDEASIRYTRLSMANKTPECLATGVPVLAYGPPAVATIAYLQQAACAQVVTARDPQALCQRIRELVTDPEPSRELGRAARQYVARHHRREDVVQGFRKAISAARGQVAAAGAAAVPGSPAAASRLASTLHCRRVKAITSEHLAARGADRWALTAMAAGSGAARWLQSFSVEGRTAGRRMAGSVTVQASQAVTLELSVARHGTAAYEGSSQRVALLAGQRQLLRVDHDFAHSHAALQLQLTLVAPRDAELSLHIADPDIQETAASASALFKDEELTLRAANGLLQQGDAATALRLYLLLYRRNGLHVFADNALTAARRLGLGNAMSIDDLLARLV